MVCNRKSKLSVEILNDIQTSKRSQEPTSIFFLIHRSQELLIKKLCFRFSVALFPIKKCRVRLGDMVDVILNV